MEYFFDQKEADCHYWVNLLDSSVPFSLALFCEGCCCCCCWGLVFWWPVSSSWWIFAVAAVAFGWGWDIQSGEKWCCWIQFMSWCCLWPCLCKLCWGCGVVVVGLVELLLTIVVKFFFVQAHGHRIFHLWCYVESMCLLMLLLSILSRCCCFVLLLLNLVERELLQLPWMFFS